LCLGGHTVKKIGISDVVLLKPPVSKKGCLGTGNTFVVFFFVSTFVLWLAE